VQCFQTSLSIKAAWHTSSVLERRGDAMKRVVLLPDIHLGRGSSSPMTSPMIHIGSSCMAAAAISFKGSSQLGEGKKSVAAMVYLLW
jgi:hypothetical protein